ncbi:hypothetical protein MRX96_029762 [Rhipicephalus microplus]
MLSAPLSCPLAGAGRALFLISVGVDDVADVGTQCAAMDGVVVHRLVEMVSIPYTGGYVLQAAYLTGCVSVQGNADAQMART